MCIGGICKLKEYWKMKQIKNHLITIQYFIVILMVAFVFGDRLSAQEVGQVEDEDFFEMSLEELMEVPIVVSASRQAQKMGELSAPVTVITAEDIHYSGLTTIPEILQFVPGVDMLQIDRNRFAVGVRGLHDIYSDRVLSLIDGRIADSATSGGPRFPRLTIFLEDIERIEIVRGPGGAAWGANAFTGVINIITKGPEETLGFFSSTNITHFGDSYTHLRWGGSADKWSWRQSIGYEDRESSDEAIENDNFYSHDFARNWRFDGKAFYRMSEATKWTFGLGYSHLISGDFEFGNSPLGENNRLETFRSFAKVDHKFDDDTSGYLQLFNNIAMVKEPALLKYFESETDIEGQLNFTPIARHKMSVGGNFRWIRIDGERSADAQEFVYHGAPLDEYWAGLFAIDRWEITDRLTLEGQIRGDWYSETQTDWSTRLTSLYALDEQKEHVVRFSFAKAFRAPLIILRKGSAKRIAHPLVPGAYLLNLTPPDGLDNEETYSLEAGYVGKIAEGMTLRVDGYYQRFEHLIGFTTVADPLAIGRTFFVPANVDGADSWGVETELAIEGKTGKLSAWYAYNDFEPDQSGQAFRAYLPAKHKVGLTGRLFLDDGWTLNGNYKFTSVTDGEHANPLNVINPARSHRLDLGVAKEVFNGRGELMIGVSNLLDRTNDSISGVGMLTDHETPGRMLFVRLQLRF